MTVDVQTNSKWHLYEYEKVSLTYKFAFKFEFKLIVGKKKTIKDLKKNNIKELRLLFLYLRF